MERTREGKRKRGLEDGAAAVGAVHDDADVSAGLALEKTLSGLLRQKERLASFSEEKLTMFESAIAMLVRETDARVRAAELELEEARLHFLTTLCDAYDEGNGCDFGDGDGGESSSDSETESPLPPPLRRAMDRAAELNAAGDSDTPDDWPRVVSLDADGDFEKRREGFGRRPSSAFTRATPSSPASTCSRSSSPFWDSDDGDSRSTSGGISQDSSLA